MAVRDSGVDAGFAGVAARDAGVAAGDAGVAAGAADVAARGADVVSSAILPRAATGDTLSNLLLNLLSIFACLHFPQVIPITLSTVTPLP